MRIYDRFHLPIETGERKNALYDAVKAWLEHEDQDLTIKEICDQLRSTEDVITGRPPCVTTKEGILKTNALYKVAFTFRHEIENTLGLE